MARFTSVLLLAAAALPFAFATNCGSNEFFYSKKNCCLPHGGLPSPPSPPPSFQCPTNDWYYHPEQGCCVPSHPQTPTSPPPQCHPSCTWKPDDSKCIPNSPSPSPPQNTYTPPYPPKNTYTPPSPPKATPPPSKPSPPPTSPSCPSSHFWYEPAGCCPHGGPPTTPPSPPPDTSCPPDGWYWHAGAGCCAPHHPVPPSSPPPTCKPGCSWNPGSSTCHPQPPTPPSNPPPKPSHHYKRHMKSRAVTLCPLGLEACPIKGMLTSSGDYECLDTTSELQSCGGCASMGVGQDCTAIEGVWNVACNVGKCEIGSCASGYKLSIDGKSCLKL